MSINQADFDLMNARHEWGILRSRFIKVSREVNDLHDYLVLYAVITDPGNREQIDAYFAQDFPGLWKEVQEWRSEVPVP